MDQRARMSEYENRLVKAQQDLQAASATGVAGKLNSTCCSAKHVLKQKSQHPFSADVRCDICQKGNLLHMPFFFRCDFNCNYDICAFCYYLELTDQKQLIASIRQHSQAARYPQGYSAPPMSQPMHHQPYPGQIPQARPPQPPQAKPGP